MRVLSQGFRSQIDEIAREVDPRADLQRITHSHPFEEDVGTPTLFDEPLTMRRLLRAMLRKTWSKRKPLLKKVFRKRRSCFEKEIGREESRFEKGDDDERQ